MRIANCEKCYAVFTPAHSKDRICPTCRQEPRRATIGNCRIYEAPGRCWQHIHGACSRCLEFCAEHDWVGWRKEDEQSYVACPLQEPNDMQECETLLANTPARRRRDIRAIYMHEDVEWANADSLHGILSKLGLD